MRGKNGLVLRLFREQRGVISRAQAVKAGVGEGTIDRLVRRGDWELAAYGVYRLPGTPVDWWQRAATVCLQGAPYTALSHASAAYFWRLDGFERWAPKVIDVVIPHGRTLRVASGVNVHISRTLKTTYFRYRHGAAITSVQRTLIDLAAVLDDTKLDVALDSALRRNRELEPLLTRVVNQLPARAYPGLSVLKEMLADRQVLDSALEVEVRRLSWSAGLPPPIVHFNVFVKDRWISEVDFAWPQFKLCIPAQSLLHHTKAKRFYRDQEQLSELVAGGWHPLPTTKRDVLRTPLRFIERLRETHALAKQRAALEGPGDGRASE